MLTGVNPGFFLRESVAYVLLSLLDKGLQAGHVQQAREKADLTPREAHGMGSCNNGIAAKAKHVLIRAKEILAA